MCTHFLLFFVGPHCVVGTICNDRRSLPYAAGGQRHCKPPVGPWQSPGGGRALQIWYLKVQNTAQKLNFVVQFPCTK